MELGPLGPQSGRSQSEVSVVGLVVLPLHVALQVDRDSETTQSHHHHLPLLGSGQGIELQVVQVGL